METATRAAMWSPSVFASRQRAWVRISGCESQQGRNSTPNWRLFGRTEPRIMGERRQTLVRLPPGRLSKVRPEIRQHQTQRKGKWSLEKKRVATSGETELIYKNSPHYIMPCNMPEVSVHKMDKM